MALNAIDGMLAREFGQISTLGAYLNELSDLLSDAALYLPFAFLPEAGSALTVAGDLLANVSEMAGVLGALRASGAATTDRWARVIGRWFSACSDFCSAPASLPVCGCRQ
jgi:phosphatidylglycerophosphate synthase